MGGSRGIVLAAALSALVAFPPAAAEGHVTKRSGPFEVELGWREEPPRAGAANSVEVELSDPQSGAPVTVPAGALSVEVVYGGTSRTLPLVPTAKPGLLEAPIVPTRPGSYSFDVSGEARGRPLDAGATCSPSTFECVEASGESEFPVRDPSAGELAQRLSSEAQQVRDARKRADDAWTIALLALAVATIGLAIGGVGLMASRRGSGRS